jgi:hypothetical protein
MLALMLLWRPIAGVALALRALATLGLATVRPPARPARIGAEEVLLLAASVLLASWSVRVLLADTLLAP